MYALIDCNNFYASCERLFRPDLHNSPIVVLSSGDGCVIARSNEAKALGIKMGEPFFKIKLLCQKHKVQVFSSNFTLYRDLSQRIMSIIEGAWIDTEIYSVDEAFLNLSSLRPCLQEAFCQDLQKYIFKCTGIPVSIGLGHSKTLAKISNHIAKKELKIPVFNVMRQLDWLKKIDVGDVWGVGRQWREKLLRQGIRSAYDLTQMNLTDLKKQHNVMLVRVAMELQGITCFEFDAQETPRKSILSSRSFSQMQTDFTSLAQAISQHCASAYEKLRAQNSLAYEITVFVRTNRFRQDLPQYDQSASVRCITPTDDLRCITRHARQCLQQIYKAGCHYKKTGIYLMDLVDKNYQPDLFHQVCEKTEKKTEAFLTVLDKINDRYGKNTLHLASLGFNQSGYSSVQYKSPAYTTRWSEIPRISNGT